MIVGSELIDLVQAGVIIGIAEDAVRGSTVDVRLHHILQLERVHHGVLPVVTPRQNKIALTIKDLNSSPHVMQPGDFLLAGLLEQIQLPNTITAKFYLDSSLARCGLQHSASIMMKPGWPIGAPGRLTLELYNKANYHSIKLIANSPVGCIEFTRHAPVKPYVGRYGEQSVIGG